MDNFKNNQKGFAAFFITILIMAVIFGIAASIFILTYGEQKIAKNIVKSSQAYYAAEAGIEDALLRLEKGMNWSSPLTLQVGGAGATTTISDIIGGVRTITSEGEASNRIRKIQAFYSIASEEKSFYYGAQVGEGGVIMDDKSTINGNVFSNGSIVAKAETKITGTAKVAKIGNKIKGAKIEKDAYVDICENSKITGILTSASHKKCTASDFVVLTEEIATTAFPISQEEIDRWKNEAAAGGTQGEYKLRGKEQDFLGPKKIEGEMKIQNQAKLFVTGTIWVTGDITIQDEANVRLDEGNYGSFSGVIISDGKITLRDLAKALGSTGQAGSFLLLLSTLPEDPAIDIKNEFEADILYTSSGWIFIQNKTHIRGVTGYGIHLKNDAEIIYDVGLEDTSFSSGPGGSWEVTGWEEVK